MSIGQNSLTETHLLAIREEALNELFGIFQSKADKFSAQKAATSVIPARARGHVYRNARLFPGEIYTDHTRLPEQKWSMFTEPSSVPYHGTFITKKWKLVFILGYELDEFKTFYEIWYDTLDSTYLILDHFAAPVSSNFHNLDDAVTELTDLVGQEKATVHKSSLSGREQEIIKQLARGGTLGTTEAQDQYEERRLVEQLLESTIMTRQTLTQAINDNVTEYHKTKIGEMDKKDTWKLWGKFVELPQKYLGNTFKDGKQKIVGKNANATFMIGFSLQNRINIEIWLIRGEQGESGYYVFDLTSMEVIGRDIKTLRAAYTEAAKKLLVPSALLGHVS